MFLFIKIALAIFMVNLRAIDAADPGNEEDIKVNGKIRFEVTTHKNPNNSYLLEYMNENSLEQSSLDRNVKTVIIFHDVKENGSEPPTRKMIHNLHQRRNWNIILVNWGELASLNDPDIPKIFMAVGKYTAELVKWLESKEAVSRSNIYAIAIGYGANVVSSMSQVLGEPKIARITGLGLAKGTREKYQHKLTKFDADFVDVVHSDHSQNPESSFGTVDFFYLQRMYYPYGPNGPMFMSKTFSNATLQEFPIFTIAPVTDFARSIINPRQFSAIPCNDDECSGCPKNYMGFGVNPELSKNINKFYYGPREDNSEVNCKNDTAPFLQIHVW